MRHISLITLLGSFAAACFCHTAEAGTISFGTGGNTFDMEFVEIGSPGNADDTMGNPNPAGAVAYTYQMGKFEVSRDMITNANAVGGLGITLQDMSFLGGNGVNRPATGVSWNEAARFVNWLNTSTGGTEAYNFTTSGVNDNIALWTSGDAGFDASNPFRNSLATYVLPSMDEWYKAAYYDPVSMTYFDYPSSDGTIPTAVASGTGDKTAVYDGQSGPADITQAGGLSPFGIMGLGGNVFEWEETSGDLANSSGSSSRGFRGGYWGNLSISLSSSTRGDSTPSNESVSVGFRVASLSSTAAVPEPGSFALLLTGLAGLGWYKRKRLMK